MAMADTEKADTASSKEGEAWGTLEELLLACAVSRHGTQSWDCISIELQKRANSGNKRNFRNNFSNVFTPENCEHKYHALKRRFNVTGGGERDDRTAFDSDAEGGCEIWEKLSFMVDELRKLRVEELRRQVERHDVSIVSLESKVKKLEDEREKSSSKAEPVDLVKRGDRSGAGERRVRGSAEVADKSDEPEDGSFNESNSTSQRREPDPVLAVADSEPDKDCSSSGGDFEKEKVVGRTSRPSNRLGNLGGFRESVSESKREGKQSSDVQSSASLSRRKRRGDGVGSSGDEMETEEELSPANKWKGQSQPLIKFLEIVRSHKHGFVFQRRISSQETENYRSLIRQHTDLEAVQSKLDRGIYCDCQPKFYCDILLMFTNAILFFCKSSTEHAAAHELRKLVMKEIVSQRNPKPALLVKPNLESQILDPVVKKPRSSTNIVVCRRKSKYSSAKSKELEDIKVERLDTKPIVNQKKDGKNDESSDEEEQPINKRWKKLVKKEGVVNFLKRMQEHSPSKDAGVKPKDDAEELQEEGTKKVGVSKKKAIVIGKKKDEDDGAGKRRISGRRSTRGEEVEKTGTVRRGGGGRPPTRKAAMGSGGTPDSGQLSGGGMLDTGRLKRRRDGEEEASGCSGKNTSAAKKKSRR